MLSAMRFSPALSLSLWLPVEFRSRNVKFFWYQSLRRGVVFHSACFRLGLWCNISRVFHLENWPLNYFDGNKTGDKNHFYVNRTHVEILVLTFFVLSFFFFTSFSFLSKLQMDLFNKRRIFFYSIPSSFPVKCNWGWLDCCVFF